MDGVINVNKPKDMTSFDVIAILRKTLGTRKIGHTGTLDPDATGVLPVCVGKATKLVEMLTASDKQYEAEVKLGVVTDTQDLTGKVLKTLEVNISINQLGNILAEFTGPIMQVPPMYSAIKVDGKKLYELARKGETIERKPREVIIHNIELTEFNKEENSFKIVVDCSKGTYIRTLANDIGEALGCGAALASLKRTKSGRFDINGSYLLDDIKKMTENNDYSYMTTLCDVMSEFEKITIAEKNAFKLRNGVPIDVLGLNVGQIYRIFDEKKEFLAIAKKEESKLSILKTFFG